MSCVIDTGGTFDCTALKPGGIAQFVINYNLDDWKAGAITEGAGGEITNIVNAALKQGYRFDVADETNIVPGVALRPVEGNFDAYDHSLAFAMFEQTQAARDNISKMRFAKIVSIVYLNSGIGLVYGANIGMRMQEIIDNPQDPNTGGIINVTLQTKDTGPGEPNLPWVIDAGDAASTLALIEGLTTPGV